MKKYDQIVSEVLGCSVSGFYKWKKAQRPIILLLDKYFSKEELEEFTKNSELKKLELIKDLTTDELTAKLSEQYAISRDRRIQEIILLLQKKSTKDLLNALNYCFDKYDLNNRWNYDKLAIIDKIRNLLKDARTELKENQQDPKSAFFNQFNPLIKDLNEKLGFDFNINDIQILEHFMMRYKVYKTLYEINEDE